MITVRFTYLTGLKRDIFRNPQLAGSWSNWVRTPMTPVTGDDGCPAFATTLTFPDDRAGETHRWGVQFDGPGGSNTWGINLEVNDANAQDRNRRVTFPAEGGAADERYYFTYARRLGAQKWYTDGGPPRIRFSLWAPHASEVAVVFGRTDNGYITNSGGGMDPARQAFPLQPVGGGIWEGVPAGNFSDYVGAPYMFRIKNAQGNTVYRTDIHSRWQIGRGGHNPDGGTWNGHPDDLDGTVSCSVVIDQDMVRKEFEPTTDPPALIADDEFWQSEFTAGRPVPNRLNDLVIYELHIGSLGFPGTGPGTLADAMAFFDHLKALGVNAVELLPVSEFSGTLAWGYGDTHHFVIESSAGGRDKYKHFVRECHRNGIAVIQDVCYNHFDEKAERAQWQYDSTAPEQNIYYWYEGKPSDYPSPNNGYLQNESSGRAPRYWEEPVRQLFISSAAEFVEEFHVDGFRVDLTQAFHRDNHLEMKDGMRIAAANQFGAKLLREWSRTLKMLRPSVMLIAEDHTQWDAVTKTPNVGGLGFDATWYAEFYHSLIGDANTGAARVLREAGFGHDGPLALQSFAGELLVARAGKVVYHESHDEAGNADNSARTSLVAVNRAPLVGATRAFAEARCRVVAGLSILSAGTPLFFMGEEIVAQKAAKYDTISTSKEDLHGQRTGAGAQMFRYYQDLIRLRRSNPAAKSHHLDVIHAWNPSRVIAFTRRQGSNDLLVIACFSNLPYWDGYVIDTSSDRLPAGGWQETFNSDAAIYGGNDVGNFGAVIPVSNGRIHLRLPANGLLVLQRR